MPERAVEEKVSSRFVTLKICDGGFKFSSLCAVVYLVPEMLELIYAQNDSVSTFLQNCST